MIDNETLMYPAKIAEVIGLAANEINRLKKQGCPFYGRKTSVRLVRNFIYQTLGAEFSPAPNAHPQHSNGYKSGELGGSNG